MFVFWVNLSVFAQQGVGIGITKPDESAVLHIEAPDSTKGLLIPRTTTTDRNNIADPAKGLIIYNATSTSFEYYDGTQWLRLVASLLQVTCELRTFPMA